MAEEEGECVDHHSTNKTIKQTNHPFNMSSIINKAKNMISGDSTAHSTTGTGHQSNVHSNPLNGESGLGGNTSSAFAGSTNHGPHDSNLANKADPRVDSDRDGRASHNVGGSHTTGHTGLSSGTHTGTHTTGTHNTTHGTAPHSSDLLNKADPRVDSTHTNTTHSGVGATHNTHNPSAVHSSHAANVVDPRVDSTHTNTSHSGIGSSNHGSGLTGSGLTGNHTAGTTHNTHSSGLTGNHNTHSSGLTGTGTHGGISNSTNAGPHNSNLLNKADPTVDSDLSGKGNRTTHGSGGLTGHSGSHATPGSGTAQNTAGPHNSDLLNKLDPRVDSDLDGSKTMGGNKTHA